MHGCDVLSCDVMGMEFCMFVCGVYVNKKVVVQNDEFDTGA